MSIRGLVTPNMSRAKWASIVGEIANLFFPKQALFTRWKNQTFVTVLIIFERASQVSESDMTPVSPM